MTKDEFVDQLMLVNDLRKQLIALNDARRVEEQAIVDEYRVNECNQKRSALVGKYNDLIAPIQAQLKTLGY